MWQSGTYTDDGSGAVTTIGGATSTYVAESRLVSGTVFTGPVAAGSLPRSECDLRTRRQRDLAEDREGRSWC